jgi:hypothetical protein
MEGESMTEQQMIDMLRNRLERLYEACLNLPDDTFRREELARAMRQARQAVLLCDRTRTKAS